MTASLVSRDSWVDLVPPDDLPERDSMRTSAMVRRQARHGARRKSCLVGSLPIKSRCRRRSPPKRRYPLLPNLWLR